VDDFDVPADAISFVVSGNKHDQLVFDEHIPVLAFDRVAVTDA
jgi:hypothetical protein